MTDIDRDGDSAATNTKQRHYEETEVERIELHLVFLSRWVTWHVSFGVSFECWVEMNVPLQILYSARASRD